MRTSGLVFLWIASVGASTGLLFLVRVLCATFSSRIRGQIVRHPLLHVVWACIGLLSFLGVKALTEGAWPPPSMERQSQRQVLEERIQTAGGWEALRRDCARLVDQHVETGRYRWGRGDTNALPAALEALKPMRVEYFDSRYFRELSAGQELHVVRIRLFGMPASGSHATPYLGLEVVAGPAARRFRPKPANVVPGNRHTHWRVLAENIYEIY